MLLLLQISRRSRSRRSPTSRPVASRGVRRATAARSQSVPKRSSWRPAPYAVGVSFGHYGVRPFFNIGKRNDFLLFSTRARTWRSLFVCNVSPRKRAVVKITSRLSSCARRDSVSGRPKLLGQVPLLVRLLARGAQRGRENAAGALANIAGGAYEGRHAPPRRLSCANASSLLNPPYSRDGLLGREQWIVLDHT